MVRAAIAHGYLRLVAHDLGVRLDEDPEDVHQARVATRRLRSDLRTFRAYLPEDWAQDIRAELGWVAEALGRARDADVLFERLHGRGRHPRPPDAEAARPACWAGWSPSRARPARHLLKVLDTDRYGVLLDRLVAAARELPPLKAPTSWAGGGAPEARSRADPGRRLPRRAGGGRGRSATGAAGRRPPSRSPARSRRGRRRWAAPPVPTGAPASAGPAAHAPPAVADRRRARLPSPRRPFPADRRPPTPPALTVPDRDAPARHEAPGIVSRAVASPGPGRARPRTLSPADEALHEVRIRAKRLRYACEAVAPVVGNPPSPTGPGRRRPPGRAR